MVELHKTGRIITDPVVDRSTVWLRRATAEVTNRIFPNRINDPYQTLECLPTYMEGNGQGKRNGVLFLSSHPTKSDPLHELGFTFVEPYLKYIFINSALARHQYKEKIGEFSENRGVNVVPITTPHAAKVHPEYISGEGLDEFIDTSCETLAMGAAVLMTPQAQRLSHIGKPAGSLVNIFQEIEKRKINNFAIVPIGIGIIGVEDYEKHNGLNPFKEYELNIGGLYEKEILYQDLGLQNVTDTRRIGLRIERWFTHALEELTPPEYHNP